MNYFLIGANVLHIVSRKLLLWKIIFDKNCRGVSLVTAEAFLVLYLSRYLDLLYLYTGLLETIIKIAHLVVSLAVVVLMRFSPKVAESYDEELDTVPRLAILLPPFLLAVFFNKVVLIMEIFHQYSYYLEAIVMIPQFVLLYRREKYETWMLMYTIMAGAESSVRNIPMLMSWKVILEDNPYGLYSAAAQLLVIVTGTTLLLLQKMNAQKNAALNEGGEKPAFDQVWEAEKFHFEDEEKGKAAGATGTASQRK